MRFYKDPILSLIVPGDAGPGDSQIQITVNEDDVPACMQGTFAAVILFMPVNWNVLSNNACAIRFLGLRNTSFAIWESGWLMWDGTTFCGWRANQSEFASYDQGTNTLDTLTFVGQGLGSGGTVPTLQVSSVNIGGNVTGVVDIEALSIEMVGALDLDGSADITGPLDVTGATTLTGTLTQSGGAASINGVTVSTTGDTTIPGDVNVDLGTGEDVVIQDAGTNTARSIGRGNRYWICSNTATGAIGAFTIVLSSTTDMVWRAGRAYEILVGGGGLSTSLSTVVGNFVLNHLKPAETALYDFGWVGPEVGAFPQAVNLRGVVRNNTAADITATEIRLYLRSSAGTVNWTNDPSDRTETSPRWLEIRDIGRASDYPTAVQV